MRGPELLVPGRARRYAEPVQALQGGQGGGRPVGRVGAGQRREQAGEVPGLRVRRGRQDWQDWGALGRRRTAGEELERDDAVLASYEALLAQGGVRRDGAEPRGYRRGFRGGRRF